LLIFLKLRISFLKKRAIRLEQERIESEKYWKQKEIEEEKRRVMFDYLQPKPKVLPPFASSNSWNETNKKIIRKVRQPSVNVNLDKIFYKIEHLNQYEIKFLLTQGYQEFSHKSIISNKYEKYLLRPRFNESQGHLFFIYDIKEYLENEGIHVQDYTTRMPDLVFSIGENKFAIEVETGSVLSNMKKFQEKLNSLNRNYKKRWFFVVTNRNLVKKYRRYGKVIDPRFIKFNLDKIIRNA
jgi:hypothetical protein